MDLIKKKDIAPEEVLTKEVKELLLLLREHCCKIDRDVEMRGKTNELLYHLNDSLWKISISIAGIETMLACNHTSDEYKCKFCDKKNYNGEINGLRNK